MFELVNKYHPDKVADRIAGAIVDLANTKQEDAIVAAEVLIGHGKCYIITESSVEFNIKEIEDIVHRISQDNSIEVFLNDWPQDEHLAANQKTDDKVGDNGIFRGMPLTHEQLTLMRIRDDLEEKYKSDGKYIIDERTSTLIVCQSHANTEELRAYLLSKYPFQELIVNPLGDWTGGTDVDSGATNRKLGSDMGDAMTGGGLHGKDLSKADISVNIYLALTARNLNTSVEGYCAIGDSAVRVMVNNRLVSFSCIKQAAKDYIKAVGGFEKFAEHGLMR